MRRIAPEHRCCRSGRVPVEAALLCAPVARQVNPALGVRRQRRTPRVASPPPRCRGSGAVPLCCPSVPSQPAAPPLRGATVRAEPPSAGFRFLPGALPPRRAARFRPWPSPAPEQWPRSGLKGPGTASLATAGSNLPAGRVSRPGDRGARSGNRGCSSNHSLARIGHVAWAHSR